MSLFVGMCLLHRAFSNTCMIPVLAGCNHAPFLMLISAIAALTVSSHAWHCYQ